MKFLILFTCLVALASAAPFKSRLGMHLSGGSDSSSTKWGLRCDDCSASKMRGSSNINICHYNNGSKKWNSLSVASSAWDAHCRQHGDYLGACSNGVTVHTTCANAPDFDTCVNNACAALSDNDKGRYCTAVSSASRSGRTESVVILILQNQNLEGNNEVLSTEEILALVGSESYEVDMDGYAVIAVEPADGSLDASSSDDNSAVIAVSVLATVLFCAIVVLAVAKYYNLLCFQSRSKEVAVQGTEFAAVPASDVGFTFQDKEDGQYTIQPWHLQRQN